MKEALTTLSSPETEPDKFLTKRAVSLEIRKPNRAAILIARRMRASSNNEGYLSLENARKCPSFVHEQVSSLKNPSHKHMKQQTKLTTILLKRSAWRNHSFHLRPQKMR